jgi:hypothetical protein
VLEELSPRARRLVEGGVIDLETVTGSGDGGRITSGDILHAARLMEVEQSVARIETAVPQNGNSAALVQDAEAEAPATPIPEPGESASDVPVEPAAPVASYAPGEAVPAAPEITDGRHESATFTSVHVGGEPIAVKPSPWEDYNGSTEGFSDLAREGAEQSWGEAEAHLAALEQEAAVEARASDVEAPLAAHSVSQPLDQLVQSPAEEASPIPAPAAPVIAHVDQANRESGDDVELDAGEPAIDAEQAMTAPAPREEMMDFGTLEHVDPESVWAQGAEDFAPWFLAHSQQLGAVLGLEAGLSDARQFTTKSATGVLGRDDSGEDVVVVSSKNAVADDSDLGRALGMAASSGAGSVALVSAALREDQLKALAWLNNQTRSGVKWYGIEMSVVRIADSPAAMLFDLVASPAQPTSEPSGAEHAAGGQE